MTQATLYERDRLAIGAAIRGPAIVEQFDATTVIPPGWAGGSTATATWSWSGGVTLAMDAITIQILRNKVASLVDEMHYHFYRSGYSTIIRELRDFSCVILDREGRLIVAPPMFFHAPVYRHLVGRILASLWRGNGGRRIDDGDVFVSNHPYEGGLPHVSDMAFVAPVLAGGKIVAFAGLDRTQGGRRRRGRRLDLRQCHRDVPRGPAGAADQDRRRRRRRKPISSASFSPTAGSPRWCAATCMRRSR